MTIEMRAGFKYKLNSKLNTKINPTLYRVD